MRRNPLFRPCVRLTPISAAGVGGSKSGPVSCGSVPQGPVPASSIDVTGRRCPASPGRLGCRSPNHSTLVGVSRTALRIVIAEDEKLIRLDLKEMLEEEGYSVVAEVGDGESAVKSVTELRPDLAILDIKMPLLDGISAAERINAERLAPVVILTAFAQREHVERARDAGVMAFLVKPFTKADLVPAVEMAVSRFETRSDLSRESPDALLLRIYVPSERLYAAEALRLLSLFREWLTTVRGRRIRQSGYRTTNGEVYELHAEDSAVQPDLQEEFDSFSSLLRLCSEDPGAAADLLVSAGLERATSVGLVAKFEKEVRRLQIDLRHERERRMLTLRHNLEGELADNGADLPDAASKQITALLERLIPGPSASESLALLMASGIPHSPASLTVNINPQIIEAMESTIIQNVQGTVNLAPPARELLALVNRFGGQEIPALQSAVYEIEDTDAPSEARSAANRRLRQFLGQLAGTVRDVGVDLLEKYLEHKAGL
jgi:AmiR/NasT family two-component response regulator